MSDLRQAAQQALEALEYTIKPLCMCWAGCENCDPSKAPDIEKAITDLRAALAQQPEPAQEPVAWMYPDDYAGILKHQSRAEVFQKAWCNPAVCVPLYTAPPQRQDQRVEKLEAQRDALKQTLHDELANNLRLRDLGGARPDEPMLTFLERIIAERDRTKRMVEDMQAELYQRRMTGRNT